MTLDWYYLRLSVSIVRTVSWFVWMTVCEAASGMLLTFFLLCMLYAAADLWARGQVTPQAVQDERIEHVDQRAELIEKRLREEEERRIENQLETAKVLVNLADRLAQIERILAWMLWAVTLSAISVIGMVVHNVWQKIQKKPRRIPKEEL